MLNPSSTAFTLQFSYQYQYRYTKSDRDTYDFSKLGLPFFSVVPEYRNWDGYLNMLGSVPIDLFWTKS